MSANRDDIVKTLIVALQSGDMELASALLDDDFEMSGFTTKPLNKAYFLTFQDQLLAAMPDISYQLADVTRQNDRDTVGATITLTGTQIHDLLLPQFGFEVLPATGSTVALPQTYVAFQVVHDKVLKMSFDIVVGGGLSGLLQQIGTELPLLPDNTVG